MEFFEMNDSFDIQQMRYICTIAYYGSISRAARNMFMSQPALSRYVSQAEKKIGSPLFDRSAQPLRLTAVGEKYVEYAKRILNLQESMAAEINDLTDLTESRITIGMNMQQAEFLQAPMIQRFSEIRNNVSLQVSSSYWSNLLRKMNGGLLDFAIFAGDPETLPMDMLSTALYEEHFFLAAPTGLIPGTLLVDGHPDQVDGAALLSQMGEEINWIVELPGSQRRELLENFFKENDYVPKKTVLTHSENVAYRLASSGLGLALVPERTVRLLRPAGELTLYQLKGIPEKRTVYLIYSKNRSLRKLDQEFVQCMLSIEWEEILKK